MFYFYHHYLHIQCKCYSKNYLLLLVCNNLLSSCSKRFLISLFTLSLIASFSFFSLKRFLTSLFVVLSILFFSLRRFLTSLIMFSSIFFGLFSALNFSSLYVVKKLISFFQKNNCLLYSLQKRLKILSLR